MIKEGIMEGLPEHLKQAMTRIFNAVVDKDSFELKETLDELEKYEALMLCIGTAYELTVEQEREDLVNWMGSEISKWI